MLNIFTDAITNLMTFNSFDQINDIHLPHGMSVFLVNMMCLWKEKTKARNCKPKAIINLNLGKRYGTSANLKITLSSNTSMPQQLINFNF